MRKTAEQWIQAILQGGNYRWIQIGLPLGMLVCFVCGCIQYSPGIGLALAVYTFFLLLFTIFYCGICASFPPIAVVPWLVVHLFMPTHLPLWLGIPPGWAISVPDMVAAIFAVVLYIRAFHLGPTIRKWARAGD
jgi:hypothetical protein